MKRFPILLLLAASLTAFAADNDGFVPLFNGHDLTGWVNPNCAPETWSVRDGKIFCTGHPIGAMRTTRQYENFILELEWRHLQHAGNSGVFIWGTPISAPGVPFLRGIEGQVLDHGYATDYEKRTGKKSEWFTTHGDVFPIHGATMKPLGKHNGMRSFPSGEYSKGTNEWNHYRIVCNNGSIRLSVNGHEVSGGDDCNYRKGYLALESEGAPIEFRNLRIKELPSSNPAPELVAPLDPGWQSLFTGLDLRGWRTNDATKARWAAGGKIALKDGASDPAANLWTAKEFGDAEIASLIAPRQLLIEYSKAPEITGPPKPRENRRPCAAPGKLGTPDFASVEVEVEDGNATAVAFHIAILVADVIEPLENEIPFSRRISQFECRKSIIYW